MANFETNAELYMTSPVHTARGDETLDVVYRRLGELGISSLAVVDGQRLIGMISRTDLLRVGRREAGTRTKADLLTFPPRRVSDVMTSEVVVVDPRDSLAVAAAKMTTQSIHRVFVTDGDDLVGVLSTHDLMRAVRDKGVKILVSEHMSSPLFTIRANESISLATDRLDKARVSGVVVVEDDWPVGVFTQVDALAARTLPRETRVEEAMDTAILCMPVTSRLHRAAAQATRMRARRIIVTDSRSMTGILSGIDFARYVASTSVASATP